jgi:hypothetical protein
MVLTSSCQGAQASGSREIQELIQYYIPLIQYYIPLYIRHPRSFVSYSSGHISHSSSQAIFKVRFVTVSSVIRPDQRL